MKYLIYKNNTYYLSDAMNTIDNTIANSIGNSNSNKKGKTRILSKYIASVKDMPHKHFAKKYVVIYGRTTCPYCIKTIDLLSTKKNIHILFVEIDTEPMNLFSKISLLSILKPEILTHSTVPIVFDKGKFIGGSTDAENYFK